MSPLPLTLLPRLFALLLLTGALSAQGSIGLQQTVVLPTTALGDCDHATLAINDEGDVFVAWHSQIGIGLASPRQVEGVLFRRGNGWSWITPTSADVLVLGDPLVQVLGSGESCRKPDVVAVGRDFVVSWPRHLPSTGAAQLETCLIEVTPSAAILHEASPGVGYRVEGGLDAGVAGLMPDLAARSAAPRLATVVYANQISHSGTQYEFDLRAANLDFSQFPPVVSPPVSLIQPVPEDDGLAAPTGGRVLPDVVEDDLGHLVLAWEEFAEAGHLGATLSEGWIRVAHFQDGGSGSYTELGPPTTLGGPNPGIRRRRPNLATSVSDLTNTISIAWGEYPDQILHDTDVRFGQLDYSAASGGTPPVISDFGYPVISSRDQDLPVPIHARGLRLCLATRQFLADRKLTAFVALPPKGEQIVPTALTFPWRPAADLLQFGTPGTPDSRIIPMSYEAVGPQGRYRVFLILYRI